MLERKGNVLTFLPAMTRASAPFGLLVFAAFTISLLAQAQPQSRPLSGNQLREVQMFALASDDTLAELPREIAVIDNERGTASNVATPQNTAVVARLGGGKAKHRFAEGQPVRILAQLPAGSDPRQIALHSFEKRGQIRVSYLAPFGGGPETWNTHSFRARLLKDGRWLLEPAASLTPGEYCFSPKTSNDNFCFGIDAR